MTRLLMALFIAIPLLVSFGCLDSKGDKKQQMRTTLNDPMVVKHFDVIMKQDGGSNRYINEQTDIMLEVDNYERHNGRVATLKAGGDLVLTFISGPHEGALIMQELAVGSERYANVRTYFVERSVLVKATDPKSGGSVHLIVTDPLHMRPLTAAEIEIVTAEVYAKELSLSVPLEEDNPLRSIFEK